MSQNTVYRICFELRNQIYELYARSVSESDMFGFIEVAELIFNESSHLLVDPQQEKLRQEFAGVKRTYIPLHNVLRIDTLEKEGFAKIISTNGSGNLRLLPTGLRVKSRSENPSSSDKEE